MNEKHKNSCMHTILLTYYILARWWISEINRIKIMHNPELALLQQNINKYNWAVYM